MAHLKYVDSRVTFSEFPEEISLTLSISGCPCNCKNCSSDYLKTDIGTELTFEELDKLIKANSSISCLGFLGGDNNHQELVELAKYVKSKYNIKIGFYSGFDYIDISLIPYIDYYKIGRWIFPEGEKKSWWKKNCGPISFPFSNQLMFKIENGKIINISSRFRNIENANLEGYIITK